MIFVAVMWICIVTIATGVLLTGPVTASAVLITIGISLFFCAFVYAFYVENIR